MTRIVGGDEVTSRKQHPWVVMIKIGWRYVCAGVLIAPRWVITGNELFIKFFFWFVRAELVRIRFFKIQLHVQDL